jgi:hypothetical protein
VLLPNDLIVRCCVLAPESATAAERGRLLALCPSLSRELRGVFRPNKALCEELKHLKERAVEVCL